MNKKKLFLLTAVTALTSTVLVGVAAFTNVNGAKLSKTTAGDAVPHEIVFTNEHISEWMYDDDYAMSELSTSTELGYPFKTTNVEMGTNGGLIERGFNGTDSFIYRMYNCFWEYGNKDSYAFFTIDLEMDVDVAYSVQAKVYYTEHYDDGKSKSDGKRIKNFDVITEVEGMLYKLQCNVGFEQAANDYLTIDSVVINYSCTY